ncbi:MAG: hypothetical protein V8S34_01870 [Lawsonibacter sp.]
MVINPERATALEISRLLRFPSAANIETFCRGRVELMGFRLQEGTLWWASPCAPCPARSKSCPCCSVPWSGRAGAHPQRLLCAPGGDKLYLVGRPDSLDQFFRLLGRYAPKISRVFLVGGGKISSYLAMSLPRWASR